MKIPHVPIKALSLVDWARRAGTAINLLIDQAATAVGVDSFNARTGAVTLTLADVTTAIGFTPPKTLFDHYANVGNSGTSETDLYSDTIAAGQLGANGAKLDAEYGGVFVSSATATRQIKLYFGGTAIFDTGALTLSLSSAWTMYVSIIRVSSSVIRYMVSMTTEGAALAAYTAVGELTGLTLSGTNILKITGQAAGVGAASNDLLGKMATVAYYPAA